jgi:hypothetical protein
MQQLKVPWWVKESFMANPTSGRPEPAPIPSLKQMCLLELGRKLYRKGGRWPDRPRTAQSLARRFCRLHDLEGRGPLGELVAEGLAWSVELWWEASQIITDWRHALYLGQDWRDYPLCTNVWPRHDAKRWLALTRALRRLVLRLATWPVERAATRRRKRPCDVRPTPEIWTVWRWDLRDAFALGRQAK